MLTDAQLAAMATEVDDQLASLQTVPTGRLRRLKGGPGAEDGLPDAPAQRELIEKVTGEPFETFWQKYRRHLRNDLCLPDGILHEQWRKYRDVESTSAVRVSYAWLAVMGIPTGSLAPLAVAATVFLLNVMVKVGIDAVCEGAAGERDGAS
ncbi:hypothetical protein BH24GEM3_BH24GEM3_16750 [soil metagenome]